MGSRGGYVSDKESEALERITRKNLAIGNEQEVGHLFISFANEDLDAINLLRGQAKNENSELSFDDYSLKVPFDSSDADYVRKGLRERIRLSSVTLVYLSEASAGSTWVDWEIRESIKMGKGVVGLYQGAKAPSRLPPALAEHRCEVVPWRHREMMDAIERARKGRG